MNNVTQQWRHLMGCGKLLVADMKGIVWLKWKLRSHPAIAALSTDELVLLKLFRENSRRMAVVPFIPIYFLPLVGYFYPRLIYTPHFWDDSEKLHFAREALMEKVEYARDTYDLVWGGKVHVGSHRDEIYARRSILRRSGLQKSGQDNDGSGTLHSFVEPERRLTIVRLDSLSFWAVYNISRVLGLYTFRTRILREHAHVWLLINSRVDIAVTAPAALELFLVRNALPITPDEGMNRLLATCYVEECQALLTEDSGEADFIFLQILARSELRFIT